MKKISNKSAKLKSASAVWIPLLLVSALTTLNTQSAKLPKLGVDPLDDVINTLTVEEKVKLVRGTGMDTGQDSPTVGQTKDKVAGAAGNTFSIPRLGIPSITLADGPAGLRIDPKRDTDKSNTFHATAFPIANLIASSWNLKLAQEVGEAIGNESKEYGVDVLLAPALNIHRFALGGRNFEYYSEDPLLSGKIAAAVVNGVQSQGVGTSLKHFVANNHEWNRNTIDVQLSERALREIYLRGFEIAVKESNPWTIMSSYNKVNGVYTSQSSNLLTDVLRQQWGFDGVVMTDWFGGTDPVAQMQAGNDLLMPGMDYQEQAILGAVSSKKLDKKVLDHNVKNILTLVQKSLVYKQYKYTDHPDLKTHAKLSQVAAEEGMVLLKNSADTLPLKGAKSVALFGIHSFNIIIGGTGSGDVNEAYVTSLEQGLKNVGAEIEVGLAGAYKAHIKKEQANIPVSKHPLAPFMPKKALPEFSLNQKYLNASAKKYDYALVTLGKSSGEFIDRPEHDFYLTDKELAMLNMVSKTFREQGKPVVVILNVGGVIEVASWQEKADAILLAYQPGQEAGNAIANILVGNTNPSGKLTDTWPLELNDYPAAKGFPGTVLDPDAKPEGIMQTVPAKVNYVDDIWVGYRHFNKHDKEVAYPFGFGMSYTNFTYGDITLSTETFTNKITVKLAITNTGKAAGKEVVQLYISAPQNVLKKPENELKAFAKTDLLKPGETQLISFELDARALTSFDEKQDIWLAEAGQYEVNIGSSSRNILKRATFNLDENMAIEP